MNTRLHALLDIFEDELLALPIPDSPANLYEPIRYTLSLGGKRIRPLLTLLGCEMFGKPAQLAMPAALAIEVFHNFTLLHDDIMDSADVRRKLPTVHRKWNTNVAILSGDTMLVMAYGLLNQSSAADLKTVVSTFTETALLVCEGQQMDMDFAETWDITLQDYLRMIELKTAVLLSGALRMGAMHADAREADLAALHSFAINLGVAFQVQDDYLDAFGGAGFGKTPGGDIREGKRTWLTLKAMELTDSTHRDKLRSAYDLKDLDQRVKTVTDIYKTNGIDTLAKSLVRERSNLALSVLDAASGADSVKSELRALAEQLIVRAV